MKYIYVFEDVTFAQSDTPPTAEDLRAIDDGLLSVLRVEGTGDITLNLGDDIWDSMPACAIRAVTPEMALDHMGGYHEHPDVAAARSAEPETEEEEEDGDVEDLGDGTGLSEA